MDELEPSLNQSGRMITESALGFVRFTRAPAKDAIQEARKTGDAEKSSRLERLETTILKPMLKPVQRGMKEPLMERAPYVAGGVVAYGLACGFSMGGSLGHPKPGGQLQPSPVEHTEH